MPVFCIIGSSTPLQKILPVFSEYLDATVSHVFLDNENDTESIKYCNKHNIPFSDLQELKKDQILTVIGHPDYILNINSTLILPDSILKLPKSGALNFHPGKLPEYAGLHTHQWAIRNNEKTFGVTLHHMLPGIDTGPIALQSIFDVSEKDTGLSLYLKCLQEGVILVKKAIGMICNGDALPSVMQDLTHRRLYTNQMAKEGTIDWNLSVKSIVNFVRAADYAPFSSPTYQPHFEYQNHTYFVLKAAEYADLKLLKGEFKIIEEGLLAGVSDGCVLFRKVKNSEGKILNPEDLQIAFSSIEPPKST